MKRLFNFSVVLLGLYFAVMLSGCSQTSTLRKALIGKQSPYRYSQIIKENGSHIWKTKFHKIVYLYKIENDTMIIDGTVQYVQSYGDRKYRSEQVLLNYEYFTLMFVFVNNAGNVLAIESDNITRGGALVDPFCFNITIPYNKMYANVSTVSAWSARSN